MILEDVAGILSRSRLSAALQVRDILCDESPQIVDSRGVGFDLLTLMTLSFGRLGAHFVACNLSLVCFDIPRFFAAVNFAQFARALEGAWSSVRCPGAGSRAKTPSEIGVRPPPLAYRK